MADFLADFAAAQKARRKKHNDASIRRRRERQLLEIQTQAELNRPPKTNREIRAPVGRKVRVSPHVRGLLPWDCEQHAVHRSVQGDHPR